VAPLAPDLDLAIHLETGEGSTSWLSLIDRIVPPTECWFILTILAAG